jgi:epoxyqueuosine reductase
MEGARSIIIVGLNFKPGKNSTPPKNKLFGKIAEYARYDDYHTFIKNRLYKLAKLISELIKSEFKYKVCVDTTPISERSLACKAGLGYVARNKMMTNRDFG